MNTPVSAGTESFDLDFINKKAPFNERGFLSEQLQKFTYSKIHKSS